jgi:hypothetical protein
MLVLVNGISMFLITDWTDCAVSRAKQSRSNSLIYFIPISNSSPGQSWQL